MLPGTDDLGQSYPTRADAECSQRHLWCGRPDGDIGGTEGCAKMQATALGRTDHLRAM